MAHGPDDSSLHRPGLHSPCLRPAGSQIGACAVGRRTRGTCEGRSTYHVAGRIRTYVCRAINAAMKIGTPFARLVEDGGQCRSRRPE